MDSLIESEASLFFLTCTGWTNLKLNQDSSEREDLAKCKPKDTLQGKELGHRQIMSLAMSLLYFVFQKFYLGLFNIAHLIAFSFISISKCVKEVI